MTIARTAIVDDDGTLTTGTIWNNAWLTGLYDQIDAVLAASGFAVPTASTVTGAVNNWAPTGLVGSTLQRWAGVSDATFSGLAGGVKGQVFVFKNTGTKVATFLHQSGLSSAGNKFTNAATSGGTPVAAGGWLTYQYDGTDWQLVAHEQGAWITPTYAGAGFTASANAWTVDAGDVTSLRYLLRGKTLTVAFTLSSTSVTGAAAELRIQNTMYGGFTGASVIYNAGALGYQNGTISPCQVLMNATTFLALKKNDSTNWATDTNLTYMYGEITFDVT